MNVRQEIGERSMYKVLGDTIGRVGGSKAAASTMSKSKQGPSKARWIGIGLLLVGVIVAARTLPIEAWIADMQGWIDGFGPLGMLVFAVIYVAAALLFVPGSAMTLAAGAMFGLWWGTAVVSIAATTAAALAFLIARNLARGAVEGRVQRNPKFAAIDRAIGKGGWRIVGLLRLSPAVPFSLGNYMYGLTAVRFVPYVLASWIGMLPGTFMYVYIGHAGARGLSAASGGEPGEAGSTALLVIGLVATIVVTVYVTRIARRAIAAEETLEESR